MGDLSFYKKEVCKKISHNKKFAFILGCPGVLLLFLGVAGLLSISLDLIHPGTLICILPGIYFLLWANKYMIAAKNLEDDLDSVSESEESIPNHKDTSKKLKNANLMRTGVITLSAVLGTLMSMLVPIVSIEPIVWGFLGGILCLGMAIFLCEWLDS